MKKVILKVFVLDERAKRKGIKVVSGLPGVESISMDMKDQKLTVIGDIDPVDLVNKLRKFCSAEIVSVGPAKEEKKKEEPKKKDKKEKEPLKEEPKKEKEPEKEEPKKDEKKEAEMAELIKAYQIYNPYMTQQHDFVRSAEENPNACAIC